MIKNVLLIVFLFLVSMSFAQRFKGGVTAGIVGSQVAGDTYSGYNKAGIFAGAFVQLSLGGNSSMQMEITYFQKGSRENPNENNNYTSFLWRLNYVEIPLLYQYQMGRWMVEGGPSAGVLTNSYQEFNQDITSDAPGYIAPARLTLQVNLGLVFKATEKWQVILRTNNSLTNIQSENVTGDVHRLWDYGQYNDSLILGIRYII